MRPTTVSTVRDGTDTHQEIWQAISQKLHSSEAQVQTERPAGPLMAELAEEGASLYLPSACSLYMAIQQGWLSHQPSLASRPLTMSPPYKPTQAA